MPGNASTSVDVSVFDITGRRIRNLVGGLQQAGSYVATWDGRSDDGIRMTKGVYFLRARVGDERFTRQIMYLH